MSRRQVIIFAKKASKIIKRRDRAIQSRISAGASEQALTEAKMRFDRRRTQLSTAEVLNDFGIIDKAQRATIHKLTQLMANEFNKLIFHKKRPDMNKINKYREELISLLGGQENYEKFMESGMRHAKIINVLKPK